MAFHSALRRACPGGSTTDSYVDAQCDSLSAGPVPVEGRLSSYKAAPHNPKPLSAGPVPVEGRLKSFKLRESSSHRHGAGGDVHDWALRTSS
jgi:hypothetical protein